MGDRFIRGAMLALLTLAVACNGDPGRGNLIELDDLANKRVPIGKEWRDAYRIPSVDNAVLDLGPIPENATLRLGWLPIGNSTQETSSIQIYAGRTRVTTLTVPRESKWHDFTVALPPGENCRIVLGDTQGDWFAPCEVVSPGTAGKPNVLFFLIDTLRKDHLSCYGYGRPTSPNLDALARDGVLFTNLVPQSSWTRPSVASMLTSTYPNIHGAHDWPDVVRPDLPTLAEALEDHGYETHALLLNPQATPVFGIGNEFFRCVDVNAVLDRESEDAEVVDVAIETIRNTKDRPWFIYVHAMGPHAPYVPPEPFKSRFMRAEHEGTDKEIKTQRDIDLYDGEIAFTDAQFKRLVDELKALDLYDNTIILVTSDHGEEFWEHGNEFHGNSLYEELLGVPLILKLPKGKAAGQIRSALVEGIDLAPTLLELCGAPPEPRFQGRSVSDILGDPALDNRIGYASLFYRAYSMRGARKGSLKYIQDHIAGTESWFDLNTDPLEKSPMAHFDDPLLPRHVTQIATAGAQGFHLLITCGPELHTVTGTVSGEGMGDFDFRYYDSKSDCRREGGAIRFNMKTQDSLDLQKGRDKWHNEHAEQANAHLVVQADSALAITVNVRVDGEVPGPGIAFAGQEARPVILSDLTLIPSEILARPDAFDPAGLPRKFAIYTWYVPGPETLTLEDLDPETVDALEALGYLK